jgi:UDPglucose--hexose-1-phosphate uridylyltransferase
VKRTPIRLADGRRLIYFDRDESAVRDTVDRRSLASNDGASELRYDVLREEWVIVASHRQNRTFQPRRDECPLCPTTADRASEIPARDYDVVVFENRFPALRAMEQGQSEEQNLVRSGNGACEVVAFTADHDASWTTLDAAKVDLLVDVWIDRTLELSRREDIEQVFCFENRGSEIGVTLSHPHGQIYAYPYVTPRTARTLRTIETHWERTGRNLVDDVVAVERASRTRIVAATEHWTAFVPFAARWPYEVHLYPNQRVPDLAALPDGARAEFSEIYLDVVRRFDKLFDKPVPYVSALHQAPVRVGRDLLALHVEVFTTRRASGRLKYLAGTETGMDAFSNDVPPEAAAERLRAAS